MTKAAGFALALAYALFCSAATVHGRAERSACAGNEAADVQFEARTFPVRKIGDAVLFQAGMYVDADGAPNAYGPHNRGLDFISNAKNGDRFVGVATNADGHPVIQRHGRFKGFYVSTTSLRDASGSPTDPSTYVDARKVPYFVLPPEFMAQFDIALGDLAVVTNLENGKSSFAIFADVGPRGKVGEGSIALARALGLNADPRRGGNGNAGSCVSRFGAGPGQAQSGARDQPFGFEDLSPMGRLCAVQKLFDRQLTACPRPLGSTPARCDLPAPRYGYDPALPQKRT